MSFSVRPVFAPLSAYTLVLADVVFRRDPDIVDVITERAVEQIVHIGEPALLHVFVPVRVQNEHQIGQIAVGFQQRFRIFRRFRIRRKFDLDLRRLLEFRSEFFQPFAARCRLYNM